MPQSSPQLYSRVPLTELSVADLDTTELISVDLESSTSQGTLSARSTGKLGTLTGEPSQGKLGTLTGVYIPCVQNILGIIFYIRLSWWVLACLPLVEVPPICCGGPPWPAGSHPPVLLTGVYIPCVQNILGIIFYIRLSWWVLDCLPCHVMGFPPVLGEVPPVSCGGGVPPVLLTGVYVPCVDAELPGDHQDVHSQGIVGIAGVSGSLMVVAVTCASTFITALSLSAVVTNGAMKGGGPYYLIGRALGPEVGVSIGLCFFFGNAIGGSLYILGAVETLLDAMPQMALFPPQAMTVTVQAAVNVTEAAVNGTLAAAPVAAETVLSVSRHDMQAYGIITTICLCLIVFGGVHLVDRVGSLFIIPAVLAVISVFIGIFLSPDAESPAGLTGLSTTTLFANWLPSYQTTNSNGIPDPNGSFYWGFNQLLGLFNPGVTGIMVGSDRSQALRDTPAAGPLLSGQLLGLFYPGVTGIMAGSNRSEALRDTQRSIPTGTLAAIVSMTGLYVVSILLFGAVATRDLLVTDRLLTATIAWPVPAVVQMGIVLSTLGAAAQNLVGPPRLVAAIATPNPKPQTAYEFTQTPTPTPPHPTATPAHHFQVGIVLSTLGAALQNLMGAPQLLAAPPIGPSPCPCPSLLASPLFFQVGIVLSTLGAALQNLMGAPRLLAAIANDNVLPVLNAFKAESHQEPHLATLFTLLLCCSVVPIREVDYVFPVITMFFLLCCYCKSHHPPNLLIPCLHCSFVLIGDVDYVSPVITMFFLLCYCGVNLSCALLDLVDAPSWRPRWRWHHWLVSLAGALLCLGTFLHSHPRTLPLPLPHHINTFLAPPPPPPPPRRRPLLAPALALAPLARLPRWRPPLPG
ncbi:unnamed protein product [Closterium sp. NIES-64]|nr:unnamed protein product [Closterium sp. NIES-64]